MKLIIRADDVGYTKVHNLGTYKAIDEGVVTSADVMLDCEGTEEALLWLKDRPWISVGWHTHFWGRPVCDPKDVPSMVAPDGRFKFRKNQRIKAECTYEDSYRECKAQIERCISILGRKPDVCWSSKEDCCEDNDFEIAKKAVCDEYGIPHNVGYKPDRDGTMGLPDPQYAHLNIYFPMQPVSFYPKGRGLREEIREEYDPVKYYTEDVDHILGRDIVVTAWHPGYLDDYVFSETSLTVARVMDVKALTSPELRQWIRENGIELISFRDALNGTHEYQDHLKAIGSDLFIAS